MKVLAVLVLCAFAAVQGRSAGAERNKDAGEFHSFAVRIKNVEAKRFERTGESALASLGEHPYLVHLRKAVSTSGNLETGVGSLIDSRWVLTTAKVVENVRFIWVRYGVVNVINPELVTETSAVRVDPTGALAVISINRFVLSTANIAPVSLGSSPVPESGSLCAWGSDDGVPGEVLRCYNVALSSEEDGSITATSDEGVATEFDLGAPLVSEGEQVAILVAAGDDSKAGTYLPTADFADWIDGEINPEETEEESLLVKFVN